MTLFGKHQLTYSCTTERGSLGIINPEEVRIQHSLYDASYPRDLIDMALCKVSIKPVRDIQSPVYTQRKDVMRCYRFSFPGPLKHEELWKNRDRLKPYRERPQDLCSVTIMFDPTPLHSSLGARGGPTSVKLYSYGKSIARTALPPRRYSTLKVSMPGSWVGL